MNDTPNMNAYIGRFAPSPTGPLHMGSLVAAMASYLDAKAHGGQWLVRIEDLDFDRNVKGADLDILETLKRCGMEWNGEVTWQSQRTTLYEAAVQQLADHIYPCACSRKEIADSRLRMGETASQIYPGTCRAGLPNGRVPRSWRLRLPQPSLPISFTDRLLGHQEQDVSREVGDFVLKRADGFWAYQLAVVVDDAAQGVTHIVRGADLLDSTARQLHLQSLLALPHPSYLHVAVVTNADGEKLSKQTGAQALTLGESDADVLHAALRPAARFLSMEMNEMDDATTIVAFWQAAIVAWRIKQNIDQHK
jgi:glutamyl-Q tRNA(Asp) synthetase